MSENKPSILGNKYLSYLYAFRELLVLLMFYGAFFNISFFGPEITVNYGFYDYGMPFKLKAIIDSAKVDGSEGMSKRFKEYKYSSTCCIIDVYNNTDKDIRINKFRINGAYDVTDVFVDTDSYKLHEDLCCLWRYAADSDDGVVFKNFKELPAQSKIRYTIYGKFMGNTFGDFIDIVAVSKNIRIDQVGDTVGFWFFMSQNAFVPVIMLLLYFIGIGLKRVGGDE